MKESPIRFTGAEVRATLDGRKTQLRRIMKVQPPAAGYTLGTCMSTTGDRRDEGRHHWVKVDGHAVVDGSQPYFASPYGYEGDRLWVRETFRKIKGQTATWIATDYRATYQHGDRLGDVVGMSPGSWKSSGQMPRECSRILLEIIAIRVERLQDISNEDAVAEGTGVPLDMRYAAYDGFRPMWEDIHDAGSWAANPWVWVVEFKRVEASDVTEEQ
jgi:hypothetical protein